MKIRFRWLLIASLLVTSLLTACASAPSAPSAPAAPSLPANTVGAVKTVTAPTIDGSVDDVWSKAKPLAISVSGGANLPNGSTTVELRALYTADNVYFLAQWADPTESNRRMPWQKQADGTWKQLKTSTTHQENTYYEDKFAMIWNINDSIAGFNEQGCMVTCHAGETPANSGFGSKYTANAGETGDIWHWKGVRTNPVGQVDDQYVDSMRYDKDKAAEAGRHADPKTGGGYKDNKTADGKLPVSSLKDNNPAPPYWILDGEKVTFADPGYKTNDEVPGIIVAPFTGDRTDISGKGAYKVGKWTLEWGRKLTTGSQYDVQYTDLSKTYAFGVAVFDNAQVNHAWSGAASKLVFLK